ncbi:tetratricopeptide repeat protein [Candidatus Uabimicrobium sp. HlEnr_7]|uniref:tetratricopeptide repeat protein n=1 Tax=Candidatus Uabimicrobium helgolandensis TaxID=3095367 RepID=UPI003558CC24
MITKYTCAVLAILIVAESFYLWGLHFEFEQKKNKVSSDISVKRHSKEVSNLQTETKTKGTVSINSGYATLKQYKASKDYKNAILHLQRMLKKDPNRSDKKYIEMQIRFLKIKNKNPEAIKQRKSKYQIDINHKIKNQNDKIEVAKHHALKGKAYYNKKSYDMARIEYETAIKLQPKNAEYYFECGKTQMKIWPPKAKLYFEQAIKLDAIFKNKVDDLKKESKSEQK